MTSHQSPTFDARWHLSPIPNATVNLTADQLAKLEWCLGSVREELDFRMRAGKYAFRFALELALHMYGRIYDVNTIFDEISKLEGSHPRPSHNTKRASRFRRPPLKGYWHKHHHQGYFMGINLAKEWERLDFSTLMAPYIGRYVDEIAGELSYKLVIEAYRRRSAEGRITGEFIVFERLADGSNYYLTLGEHRDDQAIRERIDASKQYDQEISCDQIRGLSKDQA